MTNSIRSRGAAKLLGWGALAACGGVFIYWLNARWHQVPVGAGLIACGMPGAWALTGLLELVSGHPFMSLASKWDDLAGWQRGVLGALVVVCAFVILFGAVVIPELLYG